MGILESIEAKLDILIGIMQGENSPLSPDGRKGKRARYSEEVSNIAMARKLGTNIGNQEFRDIAECVGIQVTMHGAHPYIRKSCEGLWMETYKALSEDYNNAKKD